MAAAGLATSKTQQQQPAKVTRHQLEARKEQLERQAAEEAERRKSEFPRSLILLDSLRCSGTAEDCRCRP